MCGLKPKKYHRPYLIIEPFHPNEYVAGCLNANVTLVSGQFCFDLDNDGWFDWEPHERGYLSDPLGGNYPSQFYAGHFKIETLGQRYYYNFGATYLYVGSETFDDSGLHVTEYNYKDTNLFLPIYYAVVHIDEPHDPGVTHRATIYYGGTGDFGGVTNAS